MMNRIDTRAFGIFCITAIAALLYLPFIGNEMVFDDQSISNTMLAYADNVFDGRARTFPYFTLAFIQVIFGTIQAHRIVSLLIHVANALLLYSLFRKLLSRTIKQSDSDTHILALMGALAFAVHPIAVYGAAYLAQRTVLFALFFSLLSMHTFVRWLESDAKQNLFLSAAFSALAIFSKEHAILLPATVAAIVPIYRLGTRKSIAKIIPYLTLTLPVCVYIALQVKGIIGLRYEPFVQDFSQPESGNWWLSAATQMALFFDYLHLWLLPDVARMSIDIRIPVITDHLTLKALAYTSFGGVALALLFREGRSALLGYGMLYCWILFGIELSIVRFQEIFVLYRSYLWAPGFVLIGVALFSLMPTKILKLTVGIMILGVLFWQSHERLSSMRTSLDVWDDAKAKLVSENYPGAFRIFLNRSRTLSSMGREDEALADSNHAIALNSDSALAYVGRGLIYMKIKKPGSALADFNAALSHWPTPDVFKGYVYYFQAESFRQLGKTKEADWALLKSEQCGFKPIKVTMDLSRSAIIESMSKNKAH